MAKRLTIRRGDRVRVRPDFAPRYPHLRGTGNVIQDTSLGIAVKVTFKHFSDWIDRAHLERSDG